MWSKFLSLWHEWKFFLATAVLIPFITLGYDYFEKTNLYNEIFRTEDLRNIVEEMYSGEPDAIVRLGKHSSSTTDKMTLVYDKLIQERLNLPIQYQPFFITRFKAENSPYVDVPNIDKNGEYKIEPGGMTIDLGTEGVPAVLYYCKVSNVFEIAEECAMRPIGTKLELLEGVTIYEQKIRFRFTLAFAIFGILLSYFDRRSKTREA